MLKGIFHVHSRYSFDSLLSPRAIVEYAARNEYSIIAITDHNTIKGSLEARQYAANHYDHLQVIIGAEYTTDKGDIIGLFLKEEIRSNFAYEVIANIKQQKGIVVLPHPYVGHHLEDKLIEQCDLIEAYNSRSNRLQNEKAHELAVTYRKPELVGCDAHFYRELYLAKVNFTAASVTLRDTLLRSPRAFETAPSNWYLSSASQMIKAYKTKKMSLALSTMVTFFKRVLSSRK